MEGEDVYGALTRMEWQKVRKLCTEHPEGPFLALTERKASVLQKTLYCAEVDLVLGLLDDAQQRWPKEFEKKLGQDVNTRNNTILHVAATHDSCIRAAVKIFEYAPQLLFFDNYKGESPIFNAVRYGQLKMFKFLNRQIVLQVADEEFRLSLYKISNKHTRECYTILHVAIYNEHFELAWYIARTIPSLICEKDHNNMTGLHLLAMNPSAFRIQDWKWLKLLLPCYFRRLSVEILHEDAADVNVEDGASKSYAMTIPLWDRIKKAYRRYQAALQLAFILVKEDTEWINKIVTTSASKINDADAADYAGSSSAENLNNADDDAADGSAQASNHNNGDVNTVSAPGAATQTNPAATEESIKPPTPLVLATKYGCSEIALRIIKQHPQTVEQAGPEGSILHLAIKYRRIDIFDAVMNMRMQMRRLVRRPDDEGNSILHMVALNTPKAKVKNGSDATSTDKPKKAKLLHPWDAEVPNNETRSPAFELQEDLLLFERVEEILKTNYHKSPNKDLQAPDQLFSEKKEVLRDSAQEWMKRTAENCSLVAVLIATVAFAAAYTVPGGTDDDDGSPVLLNQTFFVVFTIADVLSLASTLTAVVVFLSILTSPFRFQDFKETLPKSLMFGISCLIFSLTMMMLAFAATIILMIKNRQEWTKIALYAVAFLPVTVLVATYLPFYVPLTRTFHYTMDKVKLMLPRFHADNSCVSITKKPTTSSELEHGRQGSCSCLFV